MKALYLAVASAFATCCLSLPINHATYSPRSDLVEGDASVKEKRTLDFKPGPELDWALDQLNADEPWETAPLPKSKRQKGGDPDGPPPYSDKVKRQKGGDPDGPPPYSDKVKRQKGGDPDGPPPYSDKVKRQEDYVS